VLIILWDNRPVRLSLPFHA